MHGCSRAFDGRAPSGYRARPVRHSAAVALILVALAPGCSRCSARREAPDAAPPAPTSVTVPILPPPRPWTFARVRVDAGIALPDRCTVRAPTARASVSPTTRFVAEPRTLGALIVADAKDAGAKQLAGVGALALNPEGISMDPREIPWTDPGLLPRLARSGSRWVAAIDQRGSVILWRSGQSEQLGRGDGFEAVDLACGEDRCALVTTRPLKVAAPGAAVWIGSAADPASLWQKVEILPGAGDTDARPFGVASFEAASGRATIATLERGEIAMHAVEGARAREVARLSMPHGALDAIALPKAVAIASSTAVDDAGCARDGRPGVHIVREGAAPVDLPMPAPPTRASIRALARGAIATWIAPVGCRVARRAVYAIVLDEQGAPSGSVVPVGDADGYAIATRGDEVDIWLAHGAEVTWTRARCAPR
jgi:hypothetical protein